MARTMISGAAEAVVSALLVTNLNARKATTFLGPNLVIKLTRRFKVNKRDDRQDFVLTIGAANYAERKFVKACRKAGNPLPVRTVRLQTFPKKRPKKRK